MKRNHSSQSGLFHPRTLLAFTLCSVSVFLAALGFAATSALPGWSLVGSPNKSAHINILNAATCASGSDCWAVGYSGGTGGSDGWPQTLIEHWDGTSWSIVPSANSRANQSNSLGGVACTSASDCWAVGAYTYYYNSLPFPTPYNQTLIEHWDGNSWSIVGSPNTSPTENNGLSAVACSSASDCWAVGSTIQHWNGTSWSIFALPTGGIKALTCTSASDCWAVGGTTIEHWNGISWASVPEPNSGAEENADDLQAVACSSASDCWAVGAYNYGESAQTLIEHWNGTSWAIVPSPNPDPNVGALNGIACASASACSAVGFYDDSSGNERTLIEQWDGTSWSVVSSPNPSSRQNRFYAATCASTSECWAIGVRTADNSASLTLVQEFAPTIPPLTGVVSRKVHGSAGTFDINLPLIGTRGIECRSPGATGFPGVDYKIVFSFVNDVANCGRASSGPVSSGPNSNQCTVFLSGVANAQYITVTLNNVLDSQNNTGNVPATMGVLVGDTSANGLVNSTDVSQTQAQSGQAVTGSNFRTDVTVNGLINSTDVSTVQSKSGTGF
jgi:hypothetical protein